MHFICRLWHSAIDKCFCYYKNLIHNKICSNSLKIDLYNDRLLFNITKYKKWLALITLKDLMKNKASIINYFFSTREIFLNFEKFNFFRSQAAFSSMTSQIRPRLMIGATEGRPWAHWNGAWQVLNLVKRLTQVKTLSSSPNLKAPVWSQSFTTGFKNWITWSIIYMKIWTMQFTNF